MIDKLQDLIKTFTRIAEQFTDLESGKTLAQIFETWNGQQIIVAISRSTGTGERPEESEPIVNDVEGFGLVSEMMFSTWDGQVFFVLGYIGVAGLVGARVINVGCLRITKGGKTTMLKTGGSVAGTAILACFAGWAIAVSGGLGAGRNLMAALHV